MNPIIKTASVLLFNLLMLAFVAQIAVVAGASPAEAGFAVALLGMATLIPRNVPEASLHNEVIRTIFSSDLQELLFPSNQFYQGAVVDTGITTDANTIEIPQDETGESQYIINPSSFPLQVVSEQDSKKTYTADYIATKPQRVGDLEQAILSYDKRAAKLRKHANTLNRLCGDTIAYGWTPTKSDFIRKTTGTATRSTSAPGASGVRKRVTKEDVLWAMGLFNDLDVPMEDRRLLIPAYMYEDLLLIDQFIDADKLRMAGNLASGQIGEVLGFRVFMRSKTPVFNGNLASPVKKSVDAKADSNNSFSALFFHPDHVRYGEGVPDVYINENLAEYLGSVMNAALRCGATASRNSEIGVLSLVEAVG